MDTARVDPLAADAAAALAPLGVAVTAAEIRVECREHRAFAVLPGDRIAWFATSPEGRMRLATERRVLDVLARRCRLAVPRVLAVSADGGVEVRSLIAGDVDAAAAYELVRNDRGAARRLGAELGEVLAELHTRVTAADVSGWLPRGPEWPASAAWVRERLPAVVSDPALHAAAADVLQRVAAIGTPAVDRVLVHADFGLHSTVLDPATGALRGVFDWEEACWADRHLDFRLLLVGGEEQPLLDAAIEAYEPVVGRAVSRDLVFLHHAAVAITYLAYRRGVAPGERWCGRTLTEDLAWTREAIARVEPEAGVPA